MRRRIAFAMALGFATSVHCYDGEKLLGAACLSEEDCWADQTCARTPTQEILDLDGSCSKEGCVEGQQLGCACARTESGEWTCGGSGLTQLPQQGGAVCICCGPGDAAEFDEALQDYVCVMPAGTGSTG